MDLLDACYPESSGNPGSLPPYSDSSLDCFEGSSTSLKDVSAPSTKGSRLSISKLTNDSDEEIPAEWGDALEEC